MLLAWTVNITDIKKRFVGALTERKKETKKDTKRERNKERKKETQ